MTPRKLAECGTRSGYERHRKLGEQACDDCKAASAVAEKARQRALGRLRERHPEEYRELYKAARDELLAEIEAYAS